MVQVDQLERSLNPKGSEVCTLYVALLTRIPVFPPVTMAVFPRGRHEV